MAISYQQVRYRCAAHLLTHMTPVPSPEAAHLACKESLTPSLLNKIVVFITSFFSSTLSPPFPPSVELLATGLSQEEYRSEVILVTPKTHPLLMNKLLCLFYVELFYSVELFLVVVLYLLNQMLIS